MFDVRSAEERRRHKQQNEAELDIARWRTEKARKKVEEVEEKKRVRKREIKEDKETDLVERMRGRKGA